MMRTLFVLLIAGTFIVYSFKAPFYTLLFYLWLAYFRPEEWVWTAFIFSLNLQLYVGFWLVLVTFLSGQRLRFGVGPLLLVLLLVQGGLSSWLSPASAAAFQYWEEFAKALLVSYLILVYVTTEKRLRLTLMVIAISLSFEGAKQGWAQLVMNPGARNDNPLALLGDNNGVAIGMLMLITLIVALIRTSSSRIEQNIGRFLAVGVAYRAISTYSRGGFIACGVVILHYILRSKRKFVSLLGVGIVAAIILPVLSESFWERMRTLETVAEGNVYIDGSAAGRLHFWQMAVVMANDRPLVGVGQNVYNLVYDSYDTSGGGYGKGRSVHSSWLGILAELGYPGLVLYILFFARGFFVGWRARRLARGHPHLKNLSIYATAIEGALLVAALGGTFVPFQYNEMLWHTFALSMAIERLVRDQVAVPQKSAVPVPLRQTALAR